MRLLALDTASAMCSVALWNGTEQTTLEQATAREHATLLLPMIHRLLAESGLSPLQLDAIAFGRGPGSFTGVRVAASVAQGLALGAGVPVLPVSDLRALALQAQVRAAEPGGGDGPPWRIVCAMDARMSEVYAASFTVERGALPDEAIEQVLPPSRLPISGADLLIGAGFAAYAIAFAPAIAVARHVFDSAEPRAREVATLALADFALGRARDAADALPTYLRDNVVR